MMPILNIGLLNMGSPQMTLLQAIQGTGLATNLKLCLDAAEAASYSSGQTWTDRSTSATNFYRGTTSGSDAADPTFNGTAGNLSRNEYWSFDGGDYFTLVSGSNPSWVQPFHKDGATFTIMAAFYPTISTVTAEAIIGDSVNSGDQTGFRYLVLGNNGNPGKTSIVVGNTTTTALNDTSTVICNDQAWNIIGVSVSENAGASGGVHFVNGSSNTFNPAYTSPATGSAVNTLTVGSQGNGGFAPKTTSRLAWIAVWDTALSAANMQAIFGQTRGRFGI